MLADRDAEPLPRDPARRDPGAQRHAVRARDDRAGQQYPADAEPDAQRRGEKQRARWAHRGRRRSPAGTAGTAAEGRATPPMINAAGIRKVANVTSASNTTTSASWNGRRDRCGSCGNSELANDGRKQVLTRVGSVGPKSQPATARFRASPSGSRRTARRIRLRERRSGRPGTPSWPGRPRSGGRHAVTFCRMRMLRTRLSTSGVPRPVTRS